MIIIFFLFHLKDSEMLNANLRLTNVKNSLTYLHDKAIIHVVVHFVFF